MKEKIYGCKAVTDTLDSMMKSGRLSHAFLLFGEKGLGKKTLAAYFAEKIVCADREINPLSYPDIIWVEHSGVKQGFSVETLRNLCGDAYILPNNGDKKVYILTDCDNISIQAQNTLLKIIEEPPPFTHFIFTAQTKSVFLATVLSRVISLGVTECSHEECAEALREKLNCSENEINEAVSCFGGNIGLCLDYIGGGETRQVVFHVKALTESIGNKSEYGILKVLTALEGTRPMAKEVLSMLGKVIRDSCVLRLDEGNYVGCDPNGARLLSSSLSTNRAEKLYTLIQNTVTEIDSNVSMNLELASLCGQIINI